MEVVVADEKKRGRDDDRPSKGGGEAEVRDEEGWSRR